MAASLSLAADIAVVSLTAFTKSPQSVLKNIKNRQLSCIYSQSWMLESSVWIWIVCDRPKAHHLPPPQKTVEIISGAILLETCMSVCRWSPCFGPPPPSAGTDCLAGAAWAAWLALSGSAPGLLVACWLLGSKLNCWLAQPLFGCLTTMLAVMPL